MGFADDAIEYAYDSSQRALKLHMKNIQWPLKANTSIITRGNGPEMFEGIETNNNIKPSHYIINETELFTRVKRMLNLISGDLNVSLLNEICDNRKLIFYVNNIDIIDDKIYLVESRFQTFSSNEQKTDEYVLSRIQL